jgi:hypothetical protein
MQSAAPLRPVVLRTCPGVKLCRTNVHHPYAPARLKEDNDGYRFDTSSMSVTNEDDIGADPNKVEMRDADGRTGSPYRRLACASVLREPAGPLSRLHLPLRRWHVLVLQVSDSLDIMSRDLPRGDRPEGEKPPDANPPDCPICQAAGLPGYPLVHEPAGWWCPRHEGFVELPANGGTGTESLESP